MFGIRKGRALLPLVASVALAAAFACGETIKEVPVETIVTQEVIKEVPVEKIVTQEVIKEVPKEVVVKEEVVKEVPVETVITQEVVKEVPVEVVKEIVVLATPAPVSPAEVAPVPINAPDPKTDTGTVTVAVTNIAPGTGLGSAQAPVEAMNYWGVGEAPFTAAVGEPVAAMLATGFTLNSDLSGGTLSIREGVEFHKGFGPMTAADVAWSMNDANAAITPESIHGQAGDFAALFGSNEWVAVDDFTVEFTFENFDPRWNSNFLNESAQAFSVFSTKALNDNGVDWLRENIVATGPFQVIEWVQDDKAVLEKVPYDHWNANAEVEKLTFLEVVEEATRVAMMQTGEIDAANISLKNSGAMIEGGFLTSGTGLGIQEGVFFSGNMWETHYAGGERKGLPLDLSGHFVHDLPWIGNPNNPNHGSNETADAPTDLEQARLVRQALARSIDRDLINEVILAGQGWPVHVEYFDTTNPRWQSKWEYPYNPAEAEVMLDTAGYPRKGNGSRFEMPFYVGPELGGGSGIAGELGDAIAGFWQEVGIDVPVLKYAYASFRPTVVGRQNTTPWLTSCDEGKSTWPWDWPKGLVMTSLTRGGFACGFENPFILEKRNQTALIGDPVRRAEINDEVVQYLYDQALAFGVVTVPEFITYNPARIASWQMSPGIFTGINDYEKIKLR